MIKKEYQKPDMTLELTEDVIITSNFISVDGEDNWNKDNGVNRDEFFKP